MKAAVFSACLALLLAGAAAQQRALQAATNTQQISIPWSTQYLDPTGGHPRAGPAGDIGRRYELTQDTNVQKSRHGSQVTAALTD